MLNVNGQLPLFSILEQVATLRQSGAHINTWTTSEGLDVVVHQKPSTYSPAPALAAIHTLLLCPKAQALIKEKAV